MYGMFDGCNSLTNLNLSNLAKKNCDNMIEEFNNKKKMNVYYIKFINLIKI